MNKTVFFTASGLIVLVTAMGAIWSVQAQDLFKHVQHGLVSNVGWFYITFVAFSLFFSVWLMFSRFGDIKLGPDHSSPEYGNFTWIAMLFSAGMGIGLLFFGVSEPVMHYLSPPHVSTDHAENAQEALKISFFHWGLHAWSIYAVFAAMLGYMSYRKGLPLLPRSLLYPVLKEKIYAWPGHLVDIFSILSTLFGVATSLGFGSSQINAGLNLLFGLEQSKQMGVLIILVITALATFSVVSGLDKGLKKLSQVNVLLAILLLMILLLLGNTNHLMQAYVQNTGAYLSDIIYKSFNLYAYEKREEWIGGWTLLYWGWWVSWAPFVGLFIARISKGRTLREFISGVLILPSAFTFLWFTVFGNSALDFIKEAGDQSAFAAMVMQDVSVALFQFLTFFPFSEVLSVLALILVFTFFISSSDSGSYVIDTLASGGALHPPVWQRVYWALLEGAVAIVLILVGGLEALQTMTIIAAFPMMWIMAVGVGCFIKMLREDYILTDTVQNHNNTVFYDPSVSWKERIRSIVQHPTLSGAKQYLRNTVAPGLTEFCAELVNKGYDAEVEGLVEDLDEHLVEHSKETGIRLVIRHDGAEDFAYGVRLKPFDVPTYTNEEHVQDEQSVYYRLEVYLLQGGQDYDIYGYSKSQVIQDAINQFERHLQFLHVVNATEPEGAVSS